MILKYLLVAAVGGAIFWILVAVLLGIVGELQKIARGRRKAREFVWDPEGYKNFCGSQESHVWHKWDDNGLERTCGGN